MDSMSAFVMGQANKDKELMVFDWEKAARIIRDQKATTAGAGLRDDWEYTGGTIFRDGKPVPKGETYVFLASTWAIPELEVDGDMIECYRMQSEVPSWGSDTYWPDEALAILNGLES